MGNSFKHHEACHFQMLRTSSPHVRCEGGRGRESRNARRARYSARDQGRYSMPRNPMQRFCVLLTFEAANESVFVCHCTLCLQCFGPFSIYRSSTSAFHPFCQFLLSFRGIEI